MKQSEIIKGNALIAKFRGLAYCNRYLFEGWYTNAEFNHRICDMDGLKYHVSWDWLMPVIEKIMNIALKEGLIEDYTIRDCIPDITATWKAVVSFIKKYNQKLGL